MKLKSLLIVAAAVQLVCAPAMAQTPSSALNPERLKLARELFDAMGGQDNIAAALDRAMTAMNRGLPAEGKSAEAARDIGQQVMRETLPQTLDIEARAYAETFDEAQLKDILAFYQSPTGQAMRVKLPELSQRTGEAMGKLMPAMLTKMLQRLCAQTTCTDQQHKTLEALQRQAVAPTP